MDCMKVSCVCVLLNIQEIHLNMSVLGTLFKYSKKLKLQE